MAFVLPTFNLECRIIDYTHTPPTPTHRLRVECQLRAPGTNVGFLNYSTNALNGGMFLLLPPLVDIRDNYWNPNTISGDWVEVPADSGRYYRCIWVDDIAKGFHNEHRFALIVKSNQYFWPVPMP